MTTTSRPGQARSARLRRIATAALAILLLSLLYLIQISIARGPWTARESVQFMARSAAEWTAWTLMAPVIVRVASAFPVGSRRSGRNFAVHAAACALAMPIWAMLVAVPITVLRLPIWGSREPGSFLDAAGTGLLQRGAYLAIVYGLIVGVATARRLVEERAAAGIRTEELHRELAAADLDHFTRLMGSDRLVERLGAVEVAMAQSVEQAEAETLALAAELHESLVRSRDILNR